MTNKQLILGIDFNNVFFGGYHSEKLINSKGMNVNAIKNFFFRIKYLKDSYDPDYIVLANDIGRDKTFRRKLYKPYKSQRKPQNDDIINQIRYTIQLSSLIGFPIINNELYEADDILGMISKYATENDMNMILVSTDKDLYQLINDNVTIFSPKSRELIDTQWLYEKYQLTPSQWIDFKILQGDISDNIPGVSEVGEVNALRLLHQYGNIENIYNNLHQLKPSLSKSFEESYNSLALIRELVTIVTDYNKIEFNRSMLENHVSYTTEVYSLISELEINSLFDIMKYSLLNNNEGIL
jgi:DNA polymerase-1